MMKKLVLGIAVCCWIGGVNGMECKIDASQTSQPNKELHQPPKKLLCVGTEDLYGNNSNYDEIEVITETPSDNSPVVSSDDDMAEKRTVVADPQWVETHSSLINTAYYDATTLRGLACEAIANKQKVSSLIEALSDDGLSAGIIASVYWDLHGRKQNYTERYNDFMEILNLLGMVHCAKCDGRCLQKELLLNAYNRGAFKEIETGGPFDEFEP